MLLQSLEGKLSPAPGQTKEAHEAQLKTISDQYYNLIPHANTTAILKSTEQIKEKAAQLEALTDIEIAQRLLREKARPPFVSRIIHFLPDLISIGRRG